MIRRSIDVAIMQRKWEDFKQKLVSLQSELCVFRVDFLDRNSFSEFCNNLYRELELYNQIFITGYFSETVREPLKDIINGRQPKVKLISQFPSETTRDKKSLEVLKKLADAGAEIKFNNRIHARFLVAKNPAQGMLLIGSFDFNTECIGKDRYDAGIRTRHPDLVESAIKLFEEIWNMPESEPIAKFLERKH